MKLLFTLMLVLPTALFSQTKKETQDWIKEKIEGMSYSHDNGKGYFGTHDYKVKFDDCSITIIQIMFDNNHDFKTTLTEVDSIPLKELSKPNLVPGESVSSFYIRAKLDTPIKITYIEPKDVSYNSSVEYRVPNYLLKDDLANRLIKAFSNLITLCGGQVTKEVF